MESIWFCNNKITFSSTNKEKHQNIHGLKQNGMQMLKFKNGFQQQQQQQQSQNYLENNFAFENAMKNLSIK